MIKELHNNPEALAKLFFELYEKISRGATRFPSFTLPWEEAPTNTKRTLRQLAAVIQGFLVIEDQEEQRYRNEYEKLLCEDDQGKIYIATPSEYEKLMREDNQADEAAAREQDRREAGG